MAMIRKILFLLLPVLFLSCRSEKTIQIWSDRKEMADIVEVYNRNDSGYRAIFQYKKDLVRSFVDSDIKPDIIIGEDLNNELIKKEMIGLTNLKTGNIDPALSAGTDINGDKRIIPLSYSPDIVLFRRNEKRVVNPDPALPLDEIRSLGIAFNEGKKRGYSPFWDDNFLLTVLNLYGADFTGGNDDTRWNSENLKKAVDYLLDWNKENGKAGDMAEFDTKYMYDNRLKILKEGRILFTSMNLGDFMTLSDFMTRDLDFRYISRNNRTDPGKIVYGGIYRKSGRYKASDRFLSWLTNPASQSAIIKSVLADNTGCFGFLGGFSSIEKINSLDFPANYPGLTGKIPEPAFLQPQMQRPVEFLSIQEKVIVPWLREKEGGAETGLNDALEKWEKLRIPF